MKKPNIAIVGIALESNAFAPVASAADFHDAIYIEGDEILDRARAPVAAIQKELSAFVTTMDATGPWQPVPFLDAVCPPWGPVDQGFFDTCLDRIDKLIADHAPLDGIYVANHGAMLATGDDDPDGAMLARLRRAVGAEVPIITTLDLHANVSQQMVSSATSIIGYRTNPHVDMTSRGEEAALMMRLCLAGMQVKAVMVRLPLMPPSTTLLTAAGPYADVMDYGQRRAQERSDEILNVSVFGGFAFSDSSHNGLSIVVTARQAQNAAVELAQEIASKAWADRARFKRDLMSIDDAVGKALENAAYPVLPASIFSDAGDNPGGGGEGRTTWLLQALIEAQAKEVLYGSFFDPKLAAQAHNVGKGGCFTACFNDGNETEFSKSLSTDAKVVALSDGQFVGRLGIYQNRALDLGPCAALQIGGDGGITVVVISARHQTADPVFFEMLGLDIAAARTVCVKSRGHFRAGFSPWFPPDTVFEVDTAGLTSPVLERFNWQRVPRPIYPLDDNAVWPPFE